MLDKLAKNEPSQKTYIKLLKGFRQLGVELTKEIDVDR